MFFQSSHLTAIKIIITIQKKPIITQNKFIIQIISKLPFAKYRPRIIFHSLPTQVYQLNLNEL